MEFTNKVIVAIIMGALIIGGFVYSPILQKPANTLHGSLTTSQTSKQNIVPRPIIACLAKEDAVVTKVIDGDTLVVEGGSHIRLLGIDADEKNYPCYDAAKRSLENLVLSKEVHLEKDVTDVDQYGRCLRTIFIGNENIDVQLVKEGLAVARFYAPDVKYKNEIAEAEQQAIKNKTGCKWNNLK